MFIKDISDLLTFSYTVSTKIGYLPGADRRVQAAEYAGHIEAGVYEQLLLFTVHSAI